MKEHGQSILKGIIADLMKMPKGHGSAAHESPKAMKIEIMEHAKPGMDEEPGEGGLHDLLGDHAGAEMDEKEPEMDFDNEGPLGALASGHEMASSGSSKPSFGKGRRR